MKLQLRKRFGLLILLLAGVGLTQLYQNCGQVAGFDVADLSVDQSTFGSLDGPHPSTQKQTLVPARKQLMVPRTYVAGLFREVFTSSRFPVSGLESLIDKWVMYKAGQFGGACNLYTSYSSRDCNGSLANTNLGAYAESNTMRESFRIQLCENILGQDAGVNAALEKLALTNASPVNGSNVTSVYGLFYRNDPPRAEIVNTLLDLDAALAAQNAKSIDRWRAILTEVCESPAWQLL